MHLLSDAEINLQIEQWEGNRFYRGPRVVFEIIFTHEHVFVLAQLLAWLAPEDGLRLTAANPVISVFIHYSAPSRFHDRLHATYRSPPLSRSRRVAEHWGRERERDHESAAAGLYFF